MYRPKHEAPRLAQTLDHAATRELTSERIRVRFEHTPRHEVKA